MLLQQPQQVSNGQLSLGHIYFNSVLHPCIVEYDVFDLKSGARILGYSSTVSGRSIAFPLAKLDSSWKGPHRVRYGIWLPLGEDIDVVYTMSDTFHLACM